MTVPGCANPLLMYGDAGVYRIERSLRFNSSDSAYLSRTPASAGNRRTWTWAGWVKRSAISGEVPLFHTPGNSNDSAYLRIYIASDQLSFTTFNSSGGIAIGVTTTQVFRDPSSWMHIVSAFDTTQATASDRLKIYVNGSQVTQFSSSNWPTQNTDYGINTSGLTHYIGLRTDGTNYANGYLADIHFIDGQALTPSSFTEVSATTGQLVPKSYTGSFGTNGFKLTFSDNSAATATTLGKDYSGNSNNWTPFNLQTTTGDPTSVAAASGALPIYNTTDTYGATKGTGTRTDANASSLVLAIPMDGANGGTTFLDLSSTIKGSGSSQVITSNGGANTSTTTSKYYGSSGYFDGGNDYLSLGSSASDWKFLHDGTVAYTVECWIYYIGYSGINGTFISTDWGASVSEGFTLSVQSGNNLACRMGNGGNSGDFMQVPDSVSTNIKTNTWTHVAVTYDLTTFRLFINGILAGSTTSKNTPSSGSPLHAPYIGGNPDTTYGGKYTNCYLQDVRIYNGISKYISGFNPPSPTQNATVGAGNDSLVDTPTSYGTDTYVGGEVRGNYCTLNPLTSSGGTYSQGNLRFVGPADYRRSNGTIAVSTGKWYWEVTLANGPYSPRTSSSQWNAFGFGLSSVSHSTTPSSAVTDAVVLQDNGYFKNFSSSVTDVGTAFSSGDVLSCAVDLDANTFTFRRNNTQVATGTIGGTAGRELVPIIISYNDQYGVMDCNFGQRPFAYTAPSGFKALCDTNLPAPVVAKPNTVMDVKLYTGNGSTQTISGLGFSPDLVWTKARSVGNSHAIWDAVRGVQQRLIPNDTVAEATRTGGLTAFTSDGFTHGSDATGNESSTTYVAWAWDAGTSTVSNTQGSITSQVRANASAGFSIVTYTGNGTSGATVGHGLGAAPSFLICKARTVSNDWGVYHRSIGNTGALALNLTIATDTSSGYFNNTSPTSTVVTLGNGSAFNYTSASMLMYAFAPVTGYSSFGSYTGNGSTDGPFVYTGFRPRWIMVKRSDSTGNWTIKDTSRPGYNVTNLNLFSNLSNAETTEYPVDLLSNGFKVREGTFSDWNASGGTYVYAAFAENPFQFSRAR